MESSWFIGVIENTMYQVFGIRIEDNGGISLVLKTITQPCIFIIIIANIL